MWLADAAYVAAAVNAGSLGFISALTCGEPAKLRDEIQKCRDLTGGKLFGVNLYISMRDDANDRLLPYLDVIATEGVGVVESAGGQPAKILPALKEAGVTVIHKVPAVRFALSAEKAGVDAVIVVGAECGGHPGYMMIGSMVQGTLGPQKLSIPVILGGGIGTGQQLAAALAMGCDGVLMGTRMLVSEEIWSHRAIKERIVAGSELDSMVIMQVFRNHHRVLRNDAAEAVAALEDQGILDFESYRPLVEGGQTREAYATGDLTKGMLDYGQGACFADAIEPAEAIIDRIVDEAVGACERIGGLRHARGGHARGGHARG